MNAKTRGAAKVGSRLTANLTVLGVIDGEGVEPIYLVWHHGVWAPMVCKVFASSSSAKREADVLNILSHPNVVRLFELEPPVFLLMPYLDGPTLAAFLARTRDKRLSIDNALRIAIHIGCALHHVHESGFLHMDVKPDNIIISRGGLPILFDFGSARHLAMPRPREIIGTDPYIAPEECRLEETGPGADVFSLGAVLFEMISGKVPFQMRSRTKPFPQLGGTPRSIRSYRTNVPKGLDELITLCLQSNPGDRPPLVSLLQELNKLIRTGPKMWPLGFDLP